MSPTFSMTIMYLLWLCRISNSDILAALKSLEEVRELLRVDRVKDLSRTILISAEPRGDQKESTLAAKSLQQMIEYQDKSFIPSENAHDYVAISRTSI